MPDFIILHLQVPSQLVVRKVGAPIWLSVIVVAWGIVAAATAAMKNAGQFYMFRFLLGMCEAGKSFSPQASLYIPDAPGFTATAGQLPSS